MTRRFQFTALMVAALLLALVVLAGWGLQQRHALGLLRAELAEAKRAAFEVSETRSLDVAPPAPARRSLLPEPVTLTVTNQFQGAYSNALIEISTLKDQTKTLQSGLNESQRELATAKRLIPERDDPT